MATKMTKDDLKFKTPQQRNLMGLLLTKFAEYDKRKQHYYGLEGMSTSHVVCKVIDDIALMRDFWPTEMVDDSRRGGYGTIYMMDEKTMTKVQTNIRTTLDKLATLGYLEKIGNDDERRWKPIKALRGVTLS